MNLLDRVSTLMRANLNDLLDRAEDPEKIIRQLLIDMNNQLLQVKTQVAASIADEKRLYQRYEENKQKSEEWQRKAELAVDKADDELAKAALARRNSYKESADGFYQQWQEQSTQVQQLKDALHQLEQKIEEAEAKKDLLIARSRRAKAETNIRQTLSTVSQTSATSEFDRMEEEPEQEARAKAMAELDSDTLEQRFATLEHESTLDTDLAALKARRGGSSDTAPTQTPGSQS